MFDSPSPFWKGLESGDYLPKILSNVFFLTIIRAGMNPAIKVTTKRIPIRIAVPKGSATRIPSEKGKLIGKTDFGFVMHIVNNRFIQCRKIFGAEYQTNHNMNTFALSHKLPFP
jgi:hypothetical protein